MEPARSGTERKADVIAKLEAPGADVWVATSPAAGPAHLVPLTFSWDGALVVLATETKSPTARNLLASGRARLGLGPTRDVVMIDAILEDALEPAGEPEGGPAGTQAVADGYARQAGWDPRRERGEYVYLRLRPRRIQAWREANELAGRTLMRDGGWLF